MAYRPAVMCDHQTQCRSWDQHYNVQLQEAAAWNKEHGLLAGDGPLPKLNTLLLEDCVNWATRSHLGLLEEGEPGHNQGSWGERYFTKYKKYMSRSKKLPVHKVGISEEKNYCGTSFCIAGYAAQLSGNLDWNEYVTPDENKIAAEPTPSYETLITQNHGTVSVPESSQNWHVAGALILGITEDEASRLFHGGNQIEQVREIATQIAESRGETLHLIPLEK